MEKVMIMKRLFAASAEDYANRGGVLGFPICSTPMVAQTTVIAVPTDVGARDRLMARHTGRQRFGLANSLQPAIVADAAKKKGPVFARDAILGL